MSESNGKNGYVKISWFVIIMVFVGGGIIANDRIRAMEDCRIENNTRQEQTRIEKEARSERIELYKCFTTIDKRLSRIEDKLNIK